MSNELTLKAVLEATKLKRKKGIGRVTESFGNFNISEPSEFAPNGRSYRSNPQDWEQKHIWVSEFLDNLGYKCKRYSSWNSDWENGNPIEAIHVDYWDDFDIIKEIIEMSTYHLRNASSKTESCKEESSHQESLTTLVDDLNRYLSSSSFRDSCGEGTDGSIVCEIVDGDWKHEHHRFRYLVDKFFTERDMDYELQITNVIESDGDWYTATYRIEVETPEDGYPSHFRMIESTFNGELSSARRVISTYDKDQVSLVKDAYDRYCKEVGDAYADDKTSEVSRIKSEYMAEAGELELLTEEEFKEIWDAYEVIGKYNAHSNA